MTCTTTGCDRKPERPTFRICDDCLARIMAAAPLPRPEPVWVQRARANRLPVKDYSAA